MYAAEDVEVVKKKRKRRGCAEKDVGGPVEKALGKGCLGGGEKEIGGTVCGKKRVGLISGSVGPEEEIMIVEGRIE